MNDVGMLKDVVVTALLPMLGNLLVLAGMVAVMLWMDVRLAGAALITVPLFWLSTTRQTRRIHTTARRQRSREGDLATTAAESLSGIKTLKALALTDSFASRFRDLRR